MNGLIPHGAGTPIISHAERTAQAAERTAQALRVIAMAPQIDPADWPHLMMSALGWDEFARQMRDGVALKSMAHPGLNGDMTGPAQ